MLSRRRCINLTNACETPGSGAMAAPKLLNLMRMKKQNHLPLIEKIQR